MGKEWKSRSSLLPLQLGNRLTEGSTLPRRRGQEREKRVALWRRLVSGYLDILCCKLVRVRMHHGPMGRSMDDGVGLCGWADG
jgi:hypothetical protein